MKAKLRGTEIYFDVAGMQLAPVKGDFVERPVLFLLHGGPGGDHLRFKQTSLELAECAQLVFIDHRGCGRSKKTKQSDYTLENNVEDVEALRKHLGLDKICILGGSYGGIVAQSYAIRYPKRVQKLILVCTAPSKDTIEEAKEALKKQGTPQQIKMAEHLWSGTFKNPKHLGQFFEAMADMYSIKARTAKKKVFQTSHTLWSHEAFNQGFHFMKTFNLISRLKKITSPTLVLAGQDDWICSVNQSRIIAKHIKHAKLKIFKNCGHAISTDAHAGYIKSVSHFLLK